MKRYASGTRSQTIFLANHQPLASIGADGARSLSPYAESKTGMDFTKAKLMSGRFPQESYAHGSDYDYNVRAILAKLVDGINFDLEVWEDAGDFYDNLDTVYGVAGCTHLFNLSCLLCLSHIVTHLKDWCPHLAVKADITVNLCFIDQVRQSLLLPLKGSPGPDESGCTRGAALST